MSKIIEVSIKKKVNCSKDVAFWNYWDHEHLDVVHKGYKKSDIMYDSKNFLFRFDDIRIPGLSFLATKTPIFMVQHDQNTLLTYSAPFGVISVTIIKIKEISKKSCSINMTYKFWLEGWKKILGPFLKIMIPKWNERVWNEDLPIKLRRQKVVNLNFKDFVGLPNKTSKRNNKGSYELSLPLPRSKNSTRDQHPFRKKNSR
tara:strand:+ start:52 stop:654 length:603 start_codon:yes stop_codon:yes gene_type:complete